MGCDANLQAQIEALQRRVTELRATVTQQEELLKQSNADCAQQIEQSRSDCAMRVEQTDAACKDNLGRLDRTLALIDRGRYAEALVEYQRVQHPDAPEERLRRTILRWAYYAVPVLIGLVLLVMAGFLLHIVFDAPTLRGKFTRLIVVVASLLMYFVARVAGVSIPELLLSSLAVANPFYWILQRLMIPALLGFAVAWFCLRQARKGHALALRVAILFSVLVLCSFVDLFVRASYALEDASELVPNATFIIGVVLCLTLTRKWGLED